MGYCERCGGFIGEGGGHCAACDAGQETWGHAAPDEPCQRCGMHLPSHELQRWKSSLYCPYCLMDLQDEERLSGNHCEKTGFLEVPCQKCWMRFSQGELRMRNGRLYCMHCLSCMEDESRYPPGLACGRCGEHFTAREAGNGESQPHCPSCLMVMDEQAKSRIQSRAGREKGMGFKCDSCKGYLPRHKMREIKSKLYCPNCVDLHVERYGACEKCMKGFDTVYVAFGKHLCSGCYMEEKARQEPSYRPTLVEGIVLSIYNALG